MNEEEEEEEELRNVVDDQRHCYTTKDECKGAESGYACPGFVFVFAIIILFFFFF